jgi:hypothetical protein
MHRPRVRWQPKAKQANQLKAKQAKQLKAKQANQLKQAKQLKQANAKQLKAKQANQLKAGHSAPLQEFHFYNKWSGDLSSFSIQDEEAVQGWEWGCYQLDGHMSCAASANGYTPTCH